MNRTYPSPLELISRVSLFAGLEKKHLKSLSEVARQSSYRPSEKIVRKGEKGDGLYVILDGRVEVRSGDKVLASFDKGSFFGEIALFDDQPRSADVVAVSPTTCFGIEASSFMRILRKEPKMAHGIMRHLANRLRKANAALTE